VISRRLAALSRSPSCCVALAFGGCAQHPSVDTLNPLDSAHSVEPLGHIKRVAAKLVRCFEVTLADVHFRKRG